jgi:hypothetical protein
MVDAFCSECRNALDESAEPAKPVAELSSQDLRERVLRRPFPSTLLLAGVGVMALGLITMASGNLVGAVNGGIGGLALIILAAAVYRWSKG